MQVQIELTSKEIDLLFEALESWEKEPSRESFNFMLITGLLSSDREKTEEKMASEKHKAEKITLGRKRRSILLKAKLMTVLDEASTDELFIKTE